MKAETSFSLKDQLFHPDKVAYLADCFVAADDSFPADTFTKKVVVAFPTLGFKERIAHITACLQDALPEDYPSALEVLLKALPAPLDPTKSDDDFGDFIFAPLSLFVAHYGCTEEHIERSLSALKEITERFSAEEAIRFFINDFPEESFAFLEACTTDDNYHVRRWVSEGTRPKLPWAQKLASHWQQPLPLLEQLYTDKTRYVTRSVANHLNDISKLDPDTVIDTLKRWNESGLQADKEMAYITRHSLRTLIKKGHKDALALLGFDEAPDITLTNLETSTPEVVVGEAFQFGCSITAHSDCALLIDYQMTFATENQKGSRKVFKLKQVQLKEGETIELHKRHPMKLMTTRRLTPGTHTIALQINGQASGELSFELLAGSISAG